jgi:hypothetical protein
MNHIWLLWVGLLFCVARSATGSVSQAQNALSTFQAFNTVVSGGVVYFSTHEGWVYDYALSVTVSYFILDGLLCLHRRDQWAYVPHHAVSAGLGLATDAGLIDKHEMLMYMTAIEFSNLFLSLYTSSRNNNILAAFAVTYLPVRGVVMPLLTYRMVREAAMHPGLAIETRLLLAASYVGLQLMSWGYSWRLLRLVRRRLRKSRVEA